MRRRWRLWRRRFFHSLGVRTPFWIHSVCLTRSGVIQGYIGMYLAADEGEITNVAVDPACRRRGIGEGLLTEMKKRAADHKIARIVLEVRVSNEGAIRLYEKQGFSSVGIRRGFYELPKEDARIMVCAL